MPSVTLYNMKKGVVGNLELPDALFNAEYNEPVIHQAVVTRLANERQGTKSTLTRSEVRGGGAKPYRQKGTGRARQGSIRSPQWVHGGVVFAPKPRDFSKKMNYKALEDLINILVKKSGYKLSDLKVLEDVDYLNDRKDYLEEEISKVKSRLNGEYIDKDRCC